jgi:hypothetical protein
MCPLPQVQGEQQQEAQHEDGGDDELRAGARVLVVNVLSRSAARGAAAFYHWPGALRADQVFAAHRNPFRLARATALAAM